MCQDEQRIAFVGKLLQLLGVNQIGGQRLVADHMDAAFQELPRRFVMHMIGRDDRYRLDAILQPRFTDRHILVGTIGARRIEPEFPTGGLSLLRG
ncbi:hypothetical protein D3C71_1579350 [compost metagenome]